PATPGWLYSTAGDTDTPRREPLCGAGAPSGPAAQRAAGRAARLLSAPPAAKGRRAEPRRAAGPASRVDAQRIPDRVLGHRADGRRPAPLRAPALSSLSAALCIGPHGLAATAALATSRSLAGQRRRLGETGGPVVRLQERVSLFHRLQAPAGPGSQPLSQSAPSRI